MSEELASNLGNLGLEEKDGKGSQEAGDHGNGAKGENMPEERPGLRKHPGATGDGRPQRVEAFNFMLDLNIPGHFPTQASARRYLHNIMFLE